MLDESAPVVLPLQTRLAKVLAGDDEETQAALLAAEAAGGGGGEGLEKSFGGLVQLLGKVWHTNVLPFPASFRRARKSACSIALRPT